MKICIIKLDAKGDVIRTLPLLLGIKIKFPDSTITWITKKESEDIIRTSSYISRVISIPFITNETFDILYNLDIETEATKLAEQINADKKYGFYSEGAFVSSYNLGGEYYLNTLFDDEIKKNNKKTYQEMMFDIAELPYYREHHPLFLSEKAKKYAEIFLKEYHVNSNKLIGIHMGASSRWPSKVWHEEMLKRFIMKASEKGYAVLLFGGPHEKERQQTLFNGLQHKGVPLLRNNADNSDLEFAALVDCCRIMICSDSFALHISLALKKPTIGLFFCTSSYEIEDYGLLTKIISPRLYEFFPEKMDVYDEVLTKSISAEKVFETMESVLNIN